MRVLEDHLARRRGHEINRLAGLHSHGDAEEIGPYRPRRLRWWRWIAEIQPIGDRRSSSSTAQPGPELLFLYGCRRRDRNRLLPLRRELIGSLVLPLCE